MSSSLHDIDLNPALRLNDANFLPSCTGQDEQSAQSSHTEPWNPFLNAHNQRSEPSADVTSTEYQGSQSCVHRQVSELVQDVDAHSSVNGISQWDDPLGIEESDLAEQSNPSSVDNLSTHSTRLLCSASGGLSQRTSPVTSASQYENQSDCVEDGVRDTESVMSPLSLDEKPTVGKRQFNKKVLDTRISQENFIDILALEPHTASSQDSEADWTIVEGPARKRRSGGMKGNAQHKCTHPGCEWTFDTISGLRYWCSSAALA